jgi:hypothetical protein
MKDIIKWFVENKEWALSGIAVAVPIAIVTWFLSRKSNVKQSQKGGDQSINIQVGQDLRINKSNKGEEYKDE